MMNDRLKRIEEFLLRIMAEKEKMDCEHVLAKAGLGCCCRRCKTARSVK